MNPAHIPAPYWGWVGGKASGQLSWVLWTGPPPHICTGCDGWCRPGDPVSSLLSPTSLLSLWCPVVWCLWYGGSAPREGGKRGRQRGGAVTCRPGTQGSAQVRWQDRPRTRAAMDKQGDDPPPVFSLRLEKVPASIKQELHRWSMWMLLAGGLPEAWDARLHAHALGTSSVYPALG